MAEVKTTLTETNPKVLYYFFVQLVIAMCFGYSEHFRDRPGMIFGSGLYLIVYLVVSQVISFALVWVMMKLKQNRSVNSPLYNNTEHAPADFPESSEGLISTVKAEHSIPEPAIHSIERAPYDQPGSFLDNGKMNHVARMKFKMDFERSHPGFFERQKNQYDYLTNNEMWLLAYIHLKLSTREIAVLLNIDPGSVRRAKTRLQRKLGLKVAK